MPSKTSIDYFDFLLADFVDAPPSHFKLRADQCLKVYDRYHGGKPAKVLEIGCGIGGLVHAFRQTGINATGMEPSAGCVRHARARYGDFYWEHGLGDEISGDELKRYGGNDLIAAFEVFPMFAYEDYPRYIESVMELLAPKGLFIMMVANYAHPYLHPYLAYSDPYTKSKVTPESLYRIARTVPGVKLLQIMRWNSASHGMIIKLRTALQIAGEKILSKTTPYIFQTPKRLDAKVQSADLFLSSHIAAVFQKVTQ